ncbi:MAG: endonuclease/exonuclease/phosphatase family protein, partial [Verrucomicrobia bacterium]|nr:endonuclease/exonuclease/phosphatase family protein [Verrucomicrobiota bacterium]
MKVMYWNCTAPSNGQSLFDQEKRQLIAIVVRALAPDLLCLDEFSKGVVDTNSADNFARNELNGAGVKYTSGEVIVNPGVHLNTVTFFKRKSPIAFAFSQGIPDKRWATGLTIRDLTKCSYNEGGRDISIWFIHANASTAGGHEAVSLAWKSVENKYQAIIGDFNCPIGHVNKGAVKPSVALYWFTQWKRNDYGSMEVPGGNPPQKIDPHDTIDYGIADAKALRLFPDDAIFLLKDKQMRKLFLNFDHFP